MLGALAAGLSGGASSFGESMRDVLSMQQQQRQHEDEQRIRQQQLDAQWQRMAQDSEYRSTQARLNAENRQQDLQREHERAMERSRRDAERDRDARERWEIQQSGEADRANQYRVDRGVAFSRELMQYIGRRPSAPDTSRYRPEDQALYERDLEAWQREVDQYDAVGRMMMKSSGLQPDEISELGLDYDQLLSDLNAMTISSAPDTRSIDPGTFSRGAQVDPGLQSKMDFTRGASPSRYLHRSAAPQAAFPPVDVRSLGGPGQNQPQLTGTVSPWRQNGGTSNSVFGGEFQREVEEFGRTLLQRQEGR